MSESIKKNFAYRSVLTVSSYIISLFTFPYVSRVLGVEGIGLVSFVDNTISYFLLFAMMGVNILGVREIAAVAKSGKSGISKVFSEILGINILFTFVILIVYFICVISIPKLNQYDTLFYIGASKLVFSTLLIEWLYNGLEDFRYVAIRSIAVKLLYAVSIFLFVKAPDDYVLYYLLTVGMVVVNAVVNIVYARHLVDMEIRDMFSFKYLKENISLGVYSIMTSMYLTFNVMFLGFSSNNTEVGYYTTAFKIYSIILGFFSAFTNVMLPRMSSLLSKGDQQGFQAYIDKSFSAMSMFSIPIILFCEILAPDIIYVLSGKGYEGAIVPMRIIMPAVLLVGIAQVLAIQVITPMKKDNVLLRASIIGACVSLIINFLLAAKFQSVGSAVVLLCSEFVVTGTYVIYAHKTHIVNISVATIVKNVLYSIPCAIVWILCVVFLDNVFVRLSVSVLSGVILWFIVNYSTGNLSKVSNIGRKVRF